MISSMMQRLRLSCLGVVFGLAVALTPGPAFAVDIDVLDVAIIQNTAASFIVNEALSSSLTTPTFYFLSNSGSPNSMLIELQEADAVTGAPLYSLAGTPLISDYLQINSFYTGSVQTGGYYYTYSCGFFSTCTGFEPTYTPRYGISFTLTSDSDPNGLPYSPYGVLVTELPGSQSHS
jgi:hypothetical protein